MKLRITSIALALIAATTLPASAQRHGDVAMEGSGVFNNRIYSGTFTMAGAVSDHGTTADSPDFTGYAGVHITRVMTMSGGEQITLTINGNHAMPSHRNTIACPRPTIAPGERLSSGRGNWSIDSGTGKYSELRGNGDWETWVIHGANGPRASTECLTGHVRNAPG